MFTRRLGGAEADYIAHLVRGLLTHHRGPSIAVVAFSEAQQTEIEDALNQLALEDPEFRELYEAELEREEEGQFVGLLVKNLENIQGDERDIVILSVCYGPDPTGKMRMNFGPINISGGEKRLNVAFSRAKHHMAVVSSIHFADITNDYNEGANCFKNYLRYAEAVSTGRTDGARRVLHSLCRWHEAVEQEQAPLSDVVSDQLAAALISRGFLVDRAVGQSHFQCDLAVRKPGDTVYRLGVLLDNPTYYEQSDILERDVMRPRLLQNFGWNVCQVFAKEWYQTRDRVLDRVMQFTAGASDAEIDEADAEEPTGAGQDSSSLDRVRQEEGRLVTPDGQCLAVPSLSGVELPIGSVVEQAHLGVESQNAVAQTDGENTRYFEFASDSSHKFWEITIDGSRHSVRFGRIGTVGQERVKEFADLSRARTDFERLVRQKLAKGYVERER